MKARFILLLSPLLLLMMIAHPVSASADPLTLTVDTTLTGDHTGSIIIGADGITLDCGGHTVTGSGSGIGIDFGGRTGVTIKNCEVMNFRSGIAGAVAATSSDNRIEGNVVTENVFGVNLFRATGNEIVGNTAANNSHAGFYLNVGSGNTWKHNESSGGLNGNLNGFVIIAGTGSVIHHNTATGARWGFNVRGGGSGNFLHHNTASGNTHGFTVAGSANNTLNHNTSTDNPTVGFQIRGNGTSGNILNHNTDTGDINTGGTGFLVWSTDGGNTLKGNTATNYRSHGFRVLNDSGSTLDGNTSNDNRTWGFLLENSSGTILNGNTAANNSRNFQIAGGSENILFRNIATDGGSGIWLRGSDNNILQMNSASGNFWDGFLIDVSDDNTIEKNKACDNASANPSIFSDARQLNSTGNIFEKNKFCTVLGIP